MDELKRQWGLNIQHGRRILNCDGQLRRKDEAPLSQAGLAKLLGVTQQTVSDWESGENAPRDAMKVQLAEVLHQDVRQLFPLTRTVAAK